MTGPTDAPAPAADAPWLSVVIPAYNEEAAIAPTLTALLDVLRRDGRPFEVIVVDNASEDRTGEVVARLVAEPAVRLLRNDRNHGKGYSVRRGMLEARGRLRLLCDADNAPSLASLPDMVDLVDSADVIIGSRNVGDSRVGRTQPPLRRLFGWTFLAMCRTVMGEPSRDIFCGFKLFTADAAEATFSRQTLEGWAFDIEILALARRFGYRVRETGIVWNDSGDSRLSMARTVLPVFRELLAARRNVRRQAPRRLPAREPERATS